ncbi:hypothetical protein BN77_0933 [Rhizobium mesoamericanum STM3625]|uniref:Uncharacterized protein n=1 Tax=Rhizobium mesoamericanum STM3625 TaxID=1211777 RepID=K0Q133_9HYPH|nr:hypothetical protein BN77_0933 [Rhizobium mesoamericanum STM3625]
MVRDPLPLTLVGTSSYIRLLSVGPAWFDPRFLLPAVGRPSAVALHFARCDQLTVGLPPTRMRLGWAHKKSGLARFSASGLAG